MTKKAKKQVELLNTVAEATATVLLKGEAKEVKILNLADNDRMIPYLEFYIEDQYVLLKIVNPRPY